jgi:hypothetical protein
MTRTFKQLSAIALACALAACGGGDDESNTEASATASASSADQDVPSVTVNQAAGTETGAMDDASIGATAAASAPTVITVRARGSLAQNGGPVMMLRIDGLLIGQTEVRSASYVDYKFPTGHVPAGAKIEVVFNNDYMVNGQDRNLFVESIAVDGAKVAATAPGVVFDRGTGARAFDNLDVLPGLSTLWWNGALRFQAPARTASPVTLVKETGAYPTNSSISLSDDGLSVAFGNGVNPACDARTGIYASPDFANGACQKRAVRASGGIKKGEFRYYEGRRLIAPANIGFGYTTAASAIDPYCCLVEINQPASPRTPPSMSVNAIGGTYVRLHNTGGYEDAASTSYYGFAVDYTGADPVVYVVTTTLVGGMAVQRQFTPGFNGADVVPFIYGHTYLAETDTKHVASMNFGQAAFHYDIPALRAQLTAYGADVSKFATGVGPR